MSPDGAVSPAKSRKRCSFPQRRREEKRENEIENDIFNSRKGAKKEIDFLEGVYTVENNAKDGDSFHYHFTRF